MILRDASIEKLCDPVSNGLLQGPLIFPFIRRQLQPASYDLRLEKPQPWASEVWLEKGQFMLGSTIESVNMPNTLVGRIEGKSSLARKGLIIHTAGFVDPGFRGTLTLEITNFSDEPFLLKEGMLIAQIAFTLLDKPAVRPYGHPELNSHYQNQKGATPSKL